jgi:hypothetical protein
MVRPQEKIEPLVQGKTGIEDMMKKINELIAAHNGDNKVETKPGTNRSKSD